MESTEESQQSRGETLRFIPRYSNQYLHPDEEEAIQRIIRESYRPTATAYFIEVCEWLKEGF
jgi:hypothetical protein